MHWVGLVLELESLFLEIYAMFVIWSTIKWIRAFRSSAFTLRDWTGSSGLALGIISATLYKWFFVYASVTGTVLAHGSALFIYYFVGGGLAVVGIILGLTGCGWIRQTAAIVSSVMVFQWLGMLDMRTEVDVFLTIVMFVLFAVFGTISLGCRYFARRKTQPEVTTP